MSILTRRWFSSFSTNHLLDPQPEAPDQTKDECEEAKKNSWQLNRNTDPKAAYEALLNMLLMGKIVESTKVSLDKFLRMDKPEEMKRMQDESAEKQKRYNELNQMLKCIRQSKESDTDKVEKIEGILYGRKGDLLKEGDNNELNCIFTTLYDLGAYDAMVEMFEACQNAEFKQTPIHLEFYCRAQLKSYYYANHSNIHIIVKILAAKGPQYHAQAESILGVMAEIKINLTARLLEGEEKNEYDKNALFLFHTLFPHEPTTSFSDIRRYYEQSLNDAIHAYESAFRFDYDPRYGNRLMYIYLEKQDEGKAREIAILTFSACRRDDALHSHNFALVHAQLGAAYVLGFDAYIPELETKLLNLCVKQRHVEYASLDLKRLQIGLPQHKDRIEKLIQNIGLYKIIKKEGNETQHPFIAASYNYLSKLSNSVPGNFSLGAQLTDHAVTQEDHEIFQYLLSAPLKELLGEEGEYATLQDISDINIFLSVVDRIVRRFFKTDAWNMEDLESIEHKRFDKYMNNFFSYFGVVTKEDRKETVDSVMNISVSLKLGLGDCRHHAQVKQLFFDVWRKTRCNMYIEEIGRQFLAKNPSGVIQNAQAIEALRGYELRTMDIEVLLPIEMQEGKPVMYEGYYVKSETQTLVPVEGHTFNILFYLNKEGGGDKIEIRDAFYQKKYPWKNFEISKNDSLEKGVRAGEILVFNRKTGLLEKVDVLFTRAPYPVPQGNYRTGRDGLYVLGMGVEIGNHEDIVPSTRVPPCFRWNQHKIAPLLRAAFMAFLSSHWPHRR